MSSLAKHWFKVSVAILTLIAAWATTSESLGTLIQNLIFLGLQTTTPPQGITLTAGNYTFNRFGVGALVVFFILLVSSVVLVIGQYRQNPTVRRLRQRTSELEKKVEEQGAEIKDVTNTYETTKSQLGELQQHFNKTDDELTLLNGEYERSCQNAFRIINQLYPAGPIPRHHISKIDLDWFPKANGGGPIRLTCHIKSINDPVNYWIYRIRADEESPEVSFMKQIEFHVEDLEDTEVAYLVSRNEGRYKEVCVFFLPQIEPGKTRKIELRYRWPGFAQRLIDKNEAQYDWGFKGVPTDELSEVTFRAHFEREIGNVKCKSVGVRVKGASLKSEPGKENGVTWVYHASAVSLRDKTVSLLFRRD